MKAATIMRADQHNPSVLRVGTIDVPPAVMQHRFALEALAGAMMLAGREEPVARVIGTENTKRCELYGWGANVDSHRDDTGWMYLVLLNDGTSTLSAWARDTHACNDVVSEAMPRGAVIRLQDCCEHWTEDDGPRVAAFVGSFDRPCDAVAMAILQAGVAALARGDYYGAPRVREGFRAILPDECLAADDGMNELQPMLLADARRERRYFERCAHCKAPAVRADRLWPYSMENSRCRFHLDGAARRTPKKAQLETADHG